MARVARIATNRWSCPLKKARVRHTSNGLALLNVGCGSHFDREWTNVDLFDNEYVEFHDIRRGLPYPEAGFHAVYSSHVLEHLVPDQGRALMREMFRVLRPGGVCRTVVPDLETICREYLRYLELTSTQPTGENLLRHEWMTIELLDQLVRDRPGGAMRAFVESHGGNLSLVRERCGDEFATSYPDTQAVGAPEHGPTQPLHRRALAKSPGQLARALRRRLRLPGASNPDPRRTGEAHRWMYDRVSLKHVLEEVGFVDVRCTAYDESDIPEWSRFRLDTSATGKGPRKPDSLFVEARKPER